MEFWKNGRFWIAVLLIGAGTAAVLTGKASWDMVWGAFTGMLIRFGGGKAVGLAEPKAKDIFSADKDATP